MKLNEEIKCGWLWRWGSMWIGAHWSPEYNRVCINPLPFLTFWIAPAKIGKGAENITT